MKEQAEKRKILFICTHNSARSHMAEGLVNALYAENYKAHSAGTEPSQVNPLAIRVMAEIGIDISDHHSKGVEQFLNQEFDYVVTVCDHANETCPFFPGGKERIHNGFQDPAAQDGTEDERLAVFRRVRDEIRHWIEETFPL
ncbi:MAG: arsenate reductase ArsC [Desulfobacteraceae bacterium]|jgi:arsenate reductase